MGIGAGVDHNRLVHAHRILDFLHEFALMIRLEEGHFYAQLRGERGETSIDIIKRAGPVDIRLALSEEIQIRPVDDQDIHDTPIENKKLPEAVSDTKVNGKRCTLKLFEQLRYRHPEEESPLAEVPFGLDNENEKILLIKPAQHDHGLLRDNRNFLG